MDEKEVLQPTLVEKELLLEADQEHLFLQLVNKYAEQEYFNY